MANSLNVMRKISGPVMIALSVIVMLAWVVAPIFTGNGNNNDRGGLGTTVVTWKKGKLTDQDLGLMRMEHKLVQTFLATVYAEGQKAGAKPQVPGLNPNTGSFGIVQANDDATLLETMIMADQGKEHGIVVTDAAANTFLMNLSGGMIENENALQNIAIEVCQDVGRKANITMLYQRLKLELQAQQMRYLRIAGVNGVLPSEMWAQHEKLNRRVKIEAYPLSTEEKVAGIADPKGEDEAALKALFDEGKHLTPNPDRAEPGFKKPHRLAFGYFKIEYNKFLEIEKKNITDDQVKAAYEKGKEQGKYRKAQLPALPTNDPVPVPEGAEPPATEKPVTEEKPAEGAAPATETPAAPATEVPAAEAPAAETPATEKPAESPAPAAEEAPKSSKKADESGLQFVNFQAEGDKAAEAAPATPEAKPAEAAPATPPAAETPATPAGETPAAPAAEAPAAEKPAETPATPVAEKPAEEAKPIEYKALEEVADQIRSELASPIAQDKLQAAMAAAKKKVQTFARKYRKQKAADAASEGEKLDAAGIAKEFGLENGQTELLDSFGITDTDIGREGYRFDANALQMGGEYLINFPNFAFVGTKIPFYEVDECRGTASGDNYLFWRTAEEEEAEQTLEEARPEVVKAWKSQKAFEATQKEAEELAAKVAEGQSLKDAMPDKAKVLEPAPFSWMGRGSTPFGGGRPTLNPVPGVELAGDDFMRAVFSAPIGKAVVAFDQSKKMLYVVRVVSEEPELKIRREMFANTMKGQGRMEMMFLQREELMGFAMEQASELEKEMNVNWLVEPRADDRGN